MQQPGTIVCAILFTSNQVNLNVIRTGHCGYFFFIFFSDLKIFEKINYVLEYGEFYYPTKADHGHIIEFI